MTGKDKISNLQIRCMASHLNPAESFERVLEAAPDHLYSDFDDFRDLDDRYVVFEYDAGEGIGVATPKEIERILEEGEEKGKVFPVFKGIEASEAYVRNAVENGEGLMTAHVKDGDIYSTGYMIEGEELKGLMAFSVD